MLTDSKMLDILKEWQSGENRISIEMEECSDCESDLNPDKKPYSIRSGKMALVELNMSEIKKIFNSYSDHKNKIIKTFNAHRNQIERSNNRSIS